MFLYIASSNFQLQDDVAHAEMAGHAKESTSHDTMDHNPADEIHEGDDLPAKEMPEEAEIPEPMPDATKRLQDALMKRDSDKNPAQKRGATPKPAPNPKVKAKEQAKVLKKPITKKATPKTVCQKPKPKSHDKPVKKVKKTRELKMTVQCVYSRA